MENLVRISDLYRLAALDCLHIPEVSRERDKRYFGVFDADQANPVLKDYDSGVLQVSAREFTASIQRVKDRIFDGAKAKTSHPDIVTNAQSLPA